mmetsp:Transcript_3152/g.4260  ORF Transcript_3152/g.4260 Transcript_3152/m.4260 type:complete len:264 (-) Transcript_3152:330-1121(-)
MDTQHTILLITSHRNMNTNTIIWSTIPIVLLSWENQRTSAPNTNKLSLHQTHVSDRRIYLTSHSHTTCIPHSNFQIDSVWGAYNTEWWGERSQTINCIEIDTLLLQSNNNVTLWKGFTLQSAWRLAEVLYLGYGRFSLDRIFNGIKIYLTLVGDMNECIQCCHSFLATLLVSKDEVHPEMKIFAHVVAFQSLSMNSNKALWVALSPSRERYVVDCFPQLCCPKIEHIFIQKKIRKVEKLRNKFTNILQIFSTRTAPTCANVVK